MEVSWLLSALGLLKDILHQYNMLKDLIKDVLEGPHVKGSAMTVSTLKVVRDVFCPADILFLSLSGGTRTKLNAYSSLPATLKDRKVSMEEGFL